MVEALQFLLQTLGNLFVVAALLRFQMQLFRVPFKNPFAQFIVAVTDFAVKPLRRLIPGLFGLDLATLFLAFLVEFLVVLIGYWLLDFPFALAGGRIWPVFIGLALVRLVGLAVYLLIGMSLVRAVLSWVNPYSPLMPVVSDLTEPFMRPLRRIIPLVANVDLTPLVLILICQLLLIVPIQTTERVLLGLL
jgi:YggT family protein